MINFCLPNWLIWYHLLHLIFCEIQIDWSVVVQWIHFSCTAQLFIVFHQCKQALYFVCCRCWSGCCFCSPSMILSTVRTVIPSLNVKNRQIKQISISSCKLLLYVYFHFEKNPSFPFLVSVQIHEINFLIQRIWHRRLIYKIWS